LAAAAFRTKEVNALAYFAELFLKNPLALKWNFKVRGTPEDHFQRWESSRRIN
jgi:hypothetical protein